MKALLLGIAVAVAITPGGTSLRNTDNTVIVDNISDCSGAAKAEFEKRGLPKGDFKCVKEDTVHVEGDCSDVPGPAPTYVTATETRSDLDNGKPTVYTTTFTDVGNYEGHLCPDGVNYYFTLTQPVRDNALYPTCWEVRPVQQTNCP